MVELVATSVVLVALTLVPVTLFHLRSRIKEQESWFPNPTISPESQPISMTNAWQYVATTFSDDSLTRVWAYGLWQRGWCQPIPGSETLQIVRRGADTLQIDTASIVRIVSGNTTVGRGVESGGLVGIVWSSSALLFTTWLRPISSSEKAKLTLELEAGIR